MISVNIICVGKLKESYLKEAITEYSKRLSTYCKFTIVELNEFKLGDNPSEKEIKNALCEEAKAMQDYIKMKSSFNIAMCIEGKQLSSEKLSQKINDIGVASLSTINFYIGSSFGLAEEIKNQSQLKLSMSEMTFPHQLARVMLSEQIYRAFSILNNSKYHK